MDTDILAGERPMLYTEKHEKEKLNKTKIAEGAVTAAQKSVDGLTTKNDTNDAATLQKRMDKIADQTLKNVMLENLEEKKIKFRKLRNGSQNI